MAKKQTYKGSSVPKKGKVAPESLEVSKLFDKMLGNLYRESASIRRKSEISSRTLSIRFGSDY